jgi:hypothetical protein
LKDSTAWTCDSNPPNQTDWRGLFRAFCHLPDSLPTLPGHQTDNSQREDGECGREKPVREPLQTLMMMTWSRLHQTPESKEEPVVGLLSHGECRLQKTRCLPCLPGLGRWLAARFNMVLCNYKDLYVPAALINCFFIIILFSLLWL